MPEFTKVSGRDIGHITVYALSTCGWCRKTKAFFNDNGIAYEYIDIDMLTDAEVSEIRQKQLRHNPSGSFPTIVINDDKCIIGYDKDSLNELLGENNGR